jgi:hypothetical protein
LRILLLLHHRVLETPASSRNLAAELCAASVQVMLAESLRTHRRCFYHLGLETQPEICIASHQNYLRAPATLDV